MISGKSLEEQAKKKSKVSFFSKLFLSDFVNDDIEQSAILYKSAGKQYVIEKNYKCAIKCFEESHNIYNSLNKKSDSIESLKMIVDNCSELLDTEEQIFYRQKIADLYISNDSNYAMSNRNKQLMEISHMLELEDRFDESLEYLNKCTNSGYEIIKLSEKKADLCLKLNKFKEASIEYKKICDNQIKNHGVTYARKYIMMSIICATVVSPEYGKEINDFYCFNKLDNKRDYLISNEGRFTSEIIESTLTFNKEQFEIACGNYERVVKFNAVQLDLLWMIKDKITGDIQIGNNDTEIEEPDFR